MRSWILLIVTAAVNSLADDAPNFVQGAILGVSMSLFYILGQSEGRRQQEVK